MVAGERIRQRSSIRGVVVMLVVALVMASACSGSDDGSASGSRGDEEIAELAWGTTLAPLSLDIFNGFDNGSTTVSNPTVSSLVRWGQDGEPEPELATSWSQPDPATYVFQIRTDALFWDGTPVTPEDVVFSVERHLGDSGSQFASSVAFVESVEETGPAEVTIRLTQPDASFLRAIMSQPFVIQKEYALAHPDDLGTTGGIMSAGPYKPESFTPNQGAVLVRNDDYWGPRPAVERITIEAIPDPNALQVALESGEIDGAFDYPLTQANLFDRSSVYTTYYTPTARTSFIAFDTTSPPWDDVHVRRAVAHAVDRDAIAEGIYNGRVTPSSTIIPPIQLEVALGTDLAEQALDGLPDYSFDIDQAQEELEQSAYPDGFTAEIPFPSDDPGVSNVLQTLQSNLAPLGIDLTLNSLPSAEYRSQLFANEGGTMQIGRFSFPPAVPASPMRLLLDPDGARPNGLNLAYYTNPEVNDLRLEYNNTIDDPQRQADLVRELLTVIGEDVPYVALFFEDMALALNNEYAWESENNEYAFRGAWPSYISVGDQ